MQAAHSISSYFFRDLTLNRAQIPYRVGFSSDLQNKASRSAKHVRVRRRCTKRAERGGDLPPNGSRDMMTLSHVRLHGLAPVPLTSLRCFSSVDWADEDAPGLSRCACASGCPGPLLTPCFASCSSLLMRKRRRSVTHSRDASGARTRC